MYMHVVTREAEGSGYAFADIFEMIMRKRTGVEALLSSNGYTVWCGGGDW